MFLATVALLIPTVIAKADAPPAMADFTQVLSLVLSVLLIVTYALSLVFSLKTHRELFSGAAHAEAGEEEWPVSSRSPRSPG